MEDFTKLLTALGAFAWPLVFVFLVGKFFDPIKRLIESARERKFSLRIAGNELTMEEVSEQQRLMISDIQAKIARLEKHLGRADTGIAALATKSISVVVPTAQTVKQILWVDDQPKNNSLLIATLEERGLRIDTALSTEDGLQKFKAGNFDVVISDLGRPEGGTAGIEFARQLRALNKTIPFYIFCGGWGARTHRDAALAAGVTDITASSTTLLSHLLPEGY